MQVGFAGLGRMGRPMARHLAAAGFDVIGYDPVLPAGQEPDGLTGSGVVIVDDPRRLAEAEVSISMLPNASTTEDLLFGEMGVLTAAKPGHIHLVMGTVGPQPVRDLATKAAELGVLLADAPVSGSVSNAETATISAMIGASPEVAERIRPVLAAMTRAQFHLGAPGAGSAAKLAVNLILAAFNQALAEGLKIAQADGLDPVAFYDVLEASAVAAPYLSYKRQTFLDPEGAGVAFPMSLLLKDVTLGLELAAQHDLGLAIAEQVQQTLVVACETGLSERDMAEVGLLIKHNRTEEK